MNPGTPAARPGPGGTAVNEKAPATHRAASTGVGHVINIPGGAPRGMWAVAWRQHRIAIAVLVAIMAASAAALVWFRSRILSLFAEFGCDLFPPNPQNAGCVDHEGMDIWWNHGLDSLSQLAHLGMIGGPVVLGVFAAAPIFTREFSRGTQVFALTQSVSRRRWFAVKATVMAVPLAAGLVVLGLLMEWVDTSVGVTDQGAIGRDAFFTRSIIPAATGLLAFALAIAVGMVARAVTATLVAGLLGGFALLCGAVWIQPYVLPADRVVTSLAEIYAPVTQAELDARFSGEAPWPGFDGNAGKDDAHAGSGYLDASGKKVQLPAAGTAPCWVANNDAIEAAMQAATTGPDAISPDEYYSSAAYQNMSSAAMLQCLTDMGLDSQYVDILPATKLWPLREVMTGVLIALAALCIGIGAWRLRWAVAKR